MTPQLTVKDYQAEGFTLSLEHSYLNGNNGFIRLEKDNLFKLIPVDKDEYEQIMSTHE